MILTLASSYQAAESHVCTAYRLSEANPSATTRHDTTSPIPYLVWLNSFSSSLCSLHVNSPGCRTVELWRPGFHSARAFSASQECNRRRRHITVKSSSTRSHSSNCEMGASAAGRADRSIAIRLRNARPTRLPVPDRMKPSQPTVLMRAGCTSRTVTIWTSTLFHSPPRIRVHNGRLVSEVVRPSTVCYVRTPSAHLSPPPRKGADLRRQGRHGVKMRYLPDFPRGRFLHNRGNAQAFAVDLWNHWAAAPLMRCGGGGAMRVCRGAPPEQSTERVASLFRSALFHGGSGLQHVCTSISILRRTMSRPTWLCVSDDCVRQSQPHASFEQA
nr:hypothetical protein CFP56_11197 [Quercus suber]